MTKLNVLAVSAVAFGTLFSASAFAASTTSTATVTIKTPIAISEDTALSFGTVIPTNGAATAVVTLNFSDSATSPNATITGATTGDFTVTGAGTSGFTLSGLGTVQMTGAGTDMPLVLSSSPAAGSLALVGGTLPIAVGGALTVGANQLSGAYTASYAVTVNYN